MGLQTAGQGAWFAREGFWEGLGGLGLVGWGRCRCVFQKEGLASVRWGSGWPPRRLLPHLG